MKKRNRRLGIILVVLICAIGGYVGWQVYQAKSLASNLSAEAEKTAQNAGMNEGAGNVSVTNDQNKGSEATGIGLEQNTPSANREETPQPATAGEGTSLSLSSPQGNYKQKMENTYHVVLKAMSSVKDNTLALQQRKLSISQYKESIQQAKKDFSEAQTFVQNSPPVDPKQTPYYQEFLAGIILANQSMDTVLEGISSFNISSLYAAKGIGSTAKNKVVNGFSHF